MGKTIEEAWNITNNAVAKALDGLPPIKMHCSVLAERHSWGNKRLSPASGP